MGNVMGDLSSRRGIVQSMEDIAGGGGKIVRAEVPRAEMFGYSTSLRSLTQGRATYTMESSTTRKRRTTFRKRSSIQKRNDAALSV